jgi:hypothetical protein
VDELVVHQRPQRLEGVGTVLAPLKPITPPIAQDGQRVADLLQITMQGDVPRRAFLLAGQGLAAVKTPEKAIERASLIRGLGIARTARQRIDPGCCGLGGQRQGRAQRRPP